MNKLYFLLTAYLFAYFTGNSPSEEQICFAVSGDGFNFVALNEGQPVINSADIADKKAVRDPHILRGEDGTTFYMVVTDMKSDEGWSSNRGIVLLKSTDLKNFTLSDKGKMNFHPRHGTVILITNEELDRLITKWGSNPVPDGYMEKRMQK